MKVKVKCLFQVIAYVPQGLVCFHEVWRQNRIAPENRFLMPVIFRTGDLDLKTLQLERHQPQVLVL